jgi:hypothetical protein
MYFLYKKTFYCNKIDNMAYFYIKNKIGTIFVVIL